MPSPQEARTYVDFLGDSPVRLESAGVSAVAEAVLGGATVLIKKVRRWGKPWWYTATDTYMTNARAAQLGFRIATEGA